MKKNNNLNIKENVVRGMKNKSMQSKNTHKSKGMCKIEKKCGGCQYLNMEYKKQLQMKQNYLNDLLKKYGKIENIAGMAEPFFYRNKVHAVFKKLKTGEIISGIYEEGTHNVLPVEKCFIEDQRADAIINTIRKLVKSFKIQIYDEDRECGLLRHVLIRTAHQTGEILCVLVTAGPVFPSKNNFVKALRKEHPEVTSVVQNINPMHTSMVLGNRNQVMFGKGYIEDILCGKRFRISANSFYQINPIQTEVLYKKAIEFADIKKSDVIIDAYCGIGTIGIIASDRAKEVIGVELNREAIKDAKVNAKLNSVSNICFYNNDASNFMVELAKSGKKIDVVFMDPPRSGSDERFMSSMIKLSPKKVVYISCGPETLERDLRYLTKGGQYKVVRMGAVDMFPMTYHVETVVLLRREK